MYELFLLKLNHLDIKPCNFLAKVIDVNKYELKLADFGTSRKSENTVANTAARGTTKYMSPEMLKLFLGS